MKRLINCLSAAILMFVFSSFHFESKAQCANVTTYQPAGWDNKMVLSTVTGTNTSAASFNNSQTIYIDWAAINNGTCNFTTSFSIKLYVDGLLHTTWTSGGLNSNTYTYLHDGAVGPLTPGSHSFQIVTDANNNIAESNENDNSYSRTITVTSCVNLTSYQPSGWDNKMVLSTTTGTNTSAGSFLDNQSIYIDWAAVNNGTCNIGSTFATKLYIDGILHTTWNTPNLASNTYTYVLDGGIGTLSAGSHTLQLVFDANSNHVESNESDNSYSRTITVGSSACANLSPYQPGGWDNKIILSNVTGTTASSTTIYDNQTIYIDWAVVNSGTCNINSAFSTKLYIDGVLHTTWNTPNLASNTYTSLFDGTIGPLTAGAHSFQIVTDANSNVSEISEADNSYSRTITITAVPCANLMPYQPSGWDDKIVLSTATGTNTSSSSFYNNQTIYVDWAAINNGTCNIPQTFGTKLYVDGVLFNTYNSAGLASNSYSFVQDIAIGTLTPGTHTIQITTDANVNVAESNENDNSYQRSFTVLSTSCVNLVPYQPAGWDNIIVLSTGTGTNTSAASISNTQTIYVDWAVLNNGSCNINQSFNSKLYIDGVLHNYYTTGSVNSNSWAFASDIVIGPLAAGPHTIQITVDGDANISESNEMDNSYQRVFNVISGSCPTAPVTTAFDGVKNITTEQYQANNFRLNDVCQSAATHVWNWNSTTTTGSPIEITSTTNTWTTTNQRFGGSVSWAAKEAYIYFLNNHSRSSYDNANGDVNAYVNAVFANGASTYTDNASMSFTGGNMFVGLGASGTLANSWCTLDLIGHEYAHAVTGSSAALQYQNESGALNESFSDIFGESIENSSLGSNDWLIGGDRTSGAIRSMSNPGAYNHPDTYSGTNWVTGTSDNGGVHSNSGVQNFWFYLLAMGGNGTNDNGYAYNISGIGIAKARAIAYRNLTVYLTSTSNYAAARTGSIQAAEDLYGAGSVEAETVKLAWCAVGVGTCTPACSAPTAVTVSGGGTHCNVAILAASGGTGGTIYWQGTTSNGQSIATAAVQQGVTASGTYYFRARSACGAWGTQGSATVTISTVPNNWTGAVSTLWSNPGNWSCGVLPDGSTNVVINNGSVVVNMNAVCRSLTVAPGATVTVQTGYHLNVIN